MTHLWYCVKQHNKVTNGSMFKWPTYAIKKYGPKFASNYPCPPIMIENLPNTIFISLLEKLYVPLKSTSKLLASSIIKKYLNNTYIYIYVYMFLYYPTYTILIL